MDECNKAPAGKACRGFFCAVGEMAGGCLRKRSNDSAKSLKGFRKIIERFLKIFYELFLARLIIVHVYDY